MSKYTPEFKITVVEFANKQGGAEASRVFNVPVSTVYGWVKKFKTERNVSHDLMVARKYVDKKKHTKFPFDITLEEFQELYKSPTCSYTGKPLVESTIERINPFLGYVHGNVTIVNDNANSIKAALDSFVKNSSILKDVKIMLLKVMIKALEENQEDGHLVGTKREEGLNPAPKIKPIFKTPQQLSALVEAVKSKSFDAGKVSRILHVLVILTKGKSIGDDYDGKVEAEELFPLIPVNYHAAFRKFLQNHHKATVKELSV